MTLSDGDEYARLYLDRDAMEKLVKFTENMKTKQKEDK